MMPVHCFYFRGRVQLAKTLWHILISPFGKVRFRHFFLADIITSMTGPLQHLFIIACYYKEGSYETGETINLQKECIVANKFYWAMAFLPYWWRLAQCFNKYWETNRKVHLVNGGKYFSCIVSPAILIFVAKSDSPVYDGLKY